jgi:hypothetical protein
MQDELVLDGKTYISSKRASETSDYSQDYIGQLARKGHVEAQRVGGLWYVNIDSVLKHKDVAEEYAPVPPIRSHDHALTAGGEIVSFDGQQFISSRKAAEITGYSQDYIGQLARSEKVRSRQVGSRWYVSRKDLVEHKKHNDELLAAVQAQSVGIQRKTHVPVQREMPSESSIRYVSEERDLMPRLQKPSAREPHSGIEEHTLAVNSSILQKIDSDSPVLQVAENKRPTSAVYSKDIENKVPIRIAQPHQSIDLGSVLDLQTHNEHFQNYGYEEHNQSMKAGKRGLWAPRILLFAIVFFLSTAGYTLYRQVFSPNDIQGPDVSSGPVATLIRVVETFFTGTETYTRSGINNR